MPEISLCEIRILCLDLLFFSLGKYSSIGCLANSGIYGRKSISVSSSIMVVGSEIIILLLNFKIII